MVYQKTTRKPAEDCQKTTRRLPEDHQPSSPSKKRRPKCKINKKGPLSHRKIKCSFLDYVQLLLISQAIRAKNINQNTKKIKKSP